MPPPLPKAAPAAPESVDDIDQQFERLEFGSPSTDSVAVVPMEETRPSQRPPRGANGNQRPADLSFANPDDATQSGQIVPATLGGRVPSVPPTPQSEPTGASTTDRPRETEPLLGSSSATADDDEPAHTVNPALQNGPETSDSGPPETSPGGAGDDDYEDPTGADMHLDLESTHPGSEDGIVIADDLAESMDDETGTSPTVPPFTRNN